MLRNEGIVVCFIGGPYADHVRRYLAFDKKGPDLTFRIESATVYPGLTEAAAALETVKYEFPTLGGFKAEDVRNPEARFAGKVRFLQVRATYQVISDVSEYDFGDWETEKRRIERDMDLCPYSLS